MYKNLLGVMLVVMGCLAVGCQSHPVPAGMHASAVPVGGGVAFKFTAPSDGILYVVDSKRDELFASTSVEAGEDIEVGPDSAEQFLALIAMRDLGPSFLIQAEKDEDAALVKLEGLETPIYALYFVSLDELGATDSGTSTEAEGTNGK